MPLPQRSNPKVVVVLLNILVSFDVSIGVPAIGRQFPLRNGTFSSSTS